MIFDSPLHLARFAREHCPYYRDLYRRLPETFGWDEVPCIDPEHYWSTKAESFSDLLTQDPHDGYVWTTGGSTSQGKRVAVSAEDFREEARVFQEAFWAAGLASGDRVANLTWVGELSASFILTNAVLLEMPVLHLPIIGRTEPARIVELCRELRPTVLLTFPFVASRLAQHLLERGETLPVDKFLYAGERLLDDQRASMEKAFSPRLFATFGYAAVDCGPVAAVDRALGEDVFRPLEGYSRVEIVDDEGRPAKAGEPGRVVITNLGRRLSPVIRYPVGDVGRWIVPPDSNGKGGAFRLQERTHLSIKVAGRIVSHGEIAAEAKSIEGLSSLVQLVVTREGGVDRLTVRVCPSASGELVAAAARTLEARLRALHPWFGDPPGSAFSPLLVIEPRLADAMATTAAGKIKPIIEGRN